jgi:hypothetical protein
MNGVEPKTKALIATVFFTAVGVLALLVGTLNWQKTLPMAIFYAILVLNTYYSVKLFSGIVPSKNSIQKIFDAILVLLYVLLAVCMSSPYYFAFSALLLFITATAKYAFLLGVVSQPKLLKRKILVDLLGVLACALALGGMSFGFEMQSVWVLTVAFAVANILLFFVWPLYHLD